MVSVRREWENKVQRMKDVGASIPELEEALREKGRELRPLRINAGVLQLMIAAEKRMTITYDEFADALKMGSHWERNIILEHLFHLCKEANLPAYTSLVVSVKTGIPGDGFFKLVGVSRELKQLQEECFNTPIPDQDEIAFAILKYIKKVK